MRAQGHYDSWFSVSVCDYFFFVAVVLIVATTIVVVIAAAGAAAASATDGDGADAQFCLLVYIFRSIFYSYYYGD